MNRNELRSQITQKLIEDESFKAAFMKDPKNAIKSTFGIELPATVDIKTLEESADSITIIVPKTSNELSDSELDKVAGGCFIDSCETHDICKCALNL